MYAFQKFCSSAVVALFAVSVQASVVNGNFETGNISGWTTTSTSSVVAANLQTISGSFSGRLDASGGGFSIGTLDTFFGLAAGTIAAGNFCDPQTCFTGQGMYQSITVTAGQTITFDWKALGLEGTSSYNDVAILIREGGASLLATGAAGPVNTLVSGSYTFSSAGTFNFGFAVINGGDGCCGSSLAVDNIQTAQAAQAVPIPGTLALVGVGLLGLGYSRRKTA